MKWNTNDRMIIYRASNPVIVISLVEDNCCLLDEEVESSESFPIRKLGSLGLGNKPSLSNIITIEDMLGISSGCCCTRKRPTWKEQKISGRVQESSKYISISSNHLICVSFSLISIKDSSQAKI